jgi:hypothetical protein
MAALISPIAMATHQATSEGDFPDLRHFSFPYHEPMLLTSY